MIDHSTLILNIIKPHQSFSNTITQHNIANEFMMRCNEPITARRVRRIIESLIKQGEPIISTPHYPNGGYCWQGRGDEAMECVNRLRKKACKIFIRARKLKRNWLIEKARRGRQEQLSFAGVG